MSGHSKWASIKHKKAKVDAARGRTFTKLIREISVAARVGGGDLTGNPRLRSAVLAAKAVNMPADNIDRAIKKGTGELEGVTYEEIVYEGYGPGGVAILAEVLTDNKNRSVGEIRKIFSRHGGNMGEAGCVAFLFEKRGYIPVEAAKVDEDKLMSIALDAGAEDIQQEDGVFAVTTAPRDCEKVREALVAAAIQPLSAEVTMLPKTTVKLEGKHAEQMLKLMEELEEHDDVQHAYANFDISEELMAALSA
ncbi:MAG: YebC/PmpR family DNA-binding transcriptional regulator [Candidatus Methylomirabilota bacterium]